ncbi:uncharacterized protein RHO17_023128 [Thomomys bottae]
MLLVSKPLALGLKSSTLHSGRNWKREKPSVSRKLSLSVAPASWMQDTILSYKPRQRGKPGFPLNVNSFQVQEMFLPVHFRQDWPARHKNETRQKMKDATLGYMEKRRKGTKRINTESETQTLIEIKKFVSKSQNPGSALMCLTTQWLSSFFHRHGQDQTLPSTPPDMMLSDQLAEKGNEVAHHKIQEDHSLRQAKPSMAKDFSPILLTTSYSSD